MSQVKNDKVIFAISKKKQRQRICTPCVLTPEALSRRLVLPMRPEFSCNVSTVLRPPESDPNVGTRLLPSQLHGNHSQHSDLTSPMFSMSPYSRVLTLSFCQILPEAINIIIPIHLDF